MKIEFNNCDIKEILFNVDKGYGFVAKSWFYPQREVDLEKLCIRENGIYVNSLDSKVFFKNENDYNYGGMIFRYITNAGFYKIKVKVTEDSIPVNIGITGMRADMLERDFTWDPSGKIKKICRACWENNIWSFDYVSGNGVIDVEIEPKTIDNLATINIGIEYIIIEEIGIKVNTREATKPNIFILGDSTAQSFVYEEAIMSGWGQLFDDFFDLDKVNIINYSMGGRSLKNMYQEGRFNDIMLRAKAGDCILLQSGHNDESRDEVKGMHSRFGRGNDDKTFVRWLEEVYVPSAKIKDVQLIFVTSMTRIDSNKTKEKPVISGFQYSVNPGIHFPGIMEMVAKKYDIPVINLYKRSINYISQYSGETTKGMFLAVEAGETPGKTNTGSYANGNPSGESDGTHSKEALAKQWVRLILMEIVEKDLFPKEFMKQDVIKALRENDERLIFPEISNDVLDGDNAYYRNQIERMIKIGALTQDDKGYFYPKKAISEKEFAQGIEKIWNISLDDKGNEKLLLRERMAFFVLNAYIKKFGRDLEGKWNKPAYMTDYNGVNVSPDSPYYDPNLDGESAQYYPLVAWNHIEDRLDIDINYTEVMKECYELGLIRAEKGIECGRMVNGTYIEPKTVVTREKAAKQLFFLSVLSHDIKEENDKF